MAGGPSSTRLRPGPVVAVFLLAAVAFGIAASILAAPASGQASGAPLFPLVSFSTGLAITFGFVAAMFAIWLLMTVRRGVSAGVTRFYTTAFLLVAVLVALLLAIGPFARSTGYFGTGPPPSAPNPVQPNGTPPVNGSNVTPGPLPPWNPAWLPVLVVGALTVVLALVLLPALLARRPTESTRRPDPNTARQAVERALAALDAQPDADARQRIVALYAQLLDRVGPKIERVGSRTAREVERECRQLWQMPADSARELTGLFEEARYSDHAMPVSAVDRAREALNDALGAIDFGARPA